MRSSGSVTRNEQEKRLLRMLNSHGNANKCGECSAVYPTWASWNLGVFLCGRCASIHRSLGRDVSQPKSLSLDSWSNLELDVLESIGNKENHKIWNNKKAPFPFDDDDKDAITLFLRDKYINGSFRTTQITEDDYNLNVGGSKRHHGSRIRVKSAFGMSGSERYGSHSPDSSSSNRHSNHLSGRLEHRHISSSERKRYIDRARKLKYDYGFEDEDLSIEALVLTSGDIKEAIKLLEKEPKREEAPPPLPRRRSTAGALLDSTKTGGNSFDWLSGEQQATAQTNGAPSSAVADNQIYQYVDPNTGQIYYIDSQGQQYVDPQAEQQQQLLLQQQQQMMLMQQQQQAQQQQTDINKASVMSLYNQPTSSTSASIGSNLTQQTTAATNRTGTPSLNELQMQQQQLQMLQQQQMQLQQMQMMNGQQQGGMMMMPQQGQAPQVQMQQSGMTGYPAGGQQYFTGF